MIDPQEFLQTHPPVLSGGLIPEQNGPLASGVGARPDSRTRPDNGTDGRQQHPGRQQSHGQRSQRVSSSRRLAHRPPSDRDATTDSSSQECFDAAVRSLSAADATVSMLRQRLRRKEFSDEEIEQTVTQLSDAGLLDDERFGEDLLARCLRRSMGPSGVRREFRRKGLDDALADRLIDEAEASGRFDEAARTFVKAFRPEAGRLDRQTALRRLASRAANRGLPSGLVRRYAAELLGL